MRYFLQTQTYSCYVDLKHRGLSHDFERFRQSRVFGLARLYLVVKYFLYFLPRMGLDRWRRR